jgi:hypothetical protein
MTSEKKVILEHPIFKFSAQITKKTANRKEKKYKRNLTIYSTVGFIVRMAEQSLYSKYPKLDLRFIQQISLGYN